MLSKVCKLAFIVDDIHHQGSVKKSRIPVLKSASVLFSTYAYIYPSFNLPIPEKLYFFPHSARWICDFNDKPINKILISGRVSDIYPDRVFAQKYALKHKDKFHVLNCNVPYRGVDPSNQTLIYGQKFYDELNKYLCCFVDTARNYLLAKIFEICASGSLLLCMDTNVKNIMEKIGFIDGVNYVSCTRDNFQSKVDFILDSNNLNTINTIRLNGHTLIKTNHNWKNRMDMLKNVLEDNIDNMQKYNDYIC